jgi:hypothetical protein
MATIRVSLLAREMSAEISAQCLTIHAPRRGLGGRPVGLARTLLLPLGGELVGGHRGAVWRKAADRIREMGLHGAWGLEWVVRGRSTLSGCR